MFHLYYGNDLRGLARTLGERIDTADADALLTPEIVLIPQAGMRRWLEIELAEARGIVANLQFRLPGDFVREILRAQQPGLPPRSIFDREVLRWRLLPLLAELAAEPVGAPIAHYLRGEGAQLKRLQLAREFAAALERYQAYRRDLLDGWEHGAEPGDWQAEAWRRLVRGSAEPHRARLLGDFLAHHANGAHAPCGLPKRFALFGCLNISPDVLRFFGTLAQYCEVDCYLPTPCREYWGDLRDVRERLRAGGSPLEVSEQPLLASLGRVGREFLEQIFSYDEVQPASEHAVMREPPRTSLLGRIQADILELASPSHPAQTMAPDDSLRIHRCHSPLREVQVLHDRLLALFERDPSLQPRDIAVMMPDVAAYAPAIDSVFGALSPGDTRRIPYTIADRRAQDEHPIVEVFLSLLALPASRWGLGEILDLLAVPALMRHFDLDADALAELARWLEAAGIRWGVDASTRMAFGAGDYRAFSWAEGIERLLLGYAAGDDAAIAGIVPLPVIEGSAATVLGQALALLRELEQLAAAQRLPHSAGEWRALYQHSLAALLPVEAQDRDERRALEAVRGALDALAENARAGACDEALDWQSVRAFLSECLAEAAPQQHFLSGGVSFCGMVPLRAIPFRVIAVLGLDDAAFPRREPAGGISRLEAELRIARKLGDRSVRDDDRYLFLQLLTAAEDALHLSYVGRDVRSGQAREPSAVLAELRDLIERDYGVRAHADAGEALVVDQPLQPFARAAFDRSRAEVYTYRDEWRAAAASARTAALQVFASAPLAAAAASTPSRIPLDALIEFWRHPARTFLGGRLQLDLYAQAGRVDDDDPLLLDALANDVLKRCLIAQALGGQRALSFEADADTRMRLQLPVGRAGADGYREAAIVATVLADRAQAWRRDKTALPPCSFDVALDDGTIVECNLRSPYREGLLNIAPGAMHGRHWLRPWIEYLALAACSARVAYGFDADIAAVQIALEKEGVREYALRGIDTATARAQLDALLAGYRAGQSSALPFFPKSAWAYVQTLAGARTRDSSEEKALATARQLYDGDEHISGERDDAWVALAFRDREPLDDATDAFIDCSLCAFGLLGDVLHGGAQ